MSDWGSRLFDWSIVTTNLTLNTTRDPLGQIKSKFWIANFSESIVLKVT